MQIFPLRFGISFFTRTKKTINQQLKWFHSNILEQYPHCAVFSMNRNWFECWFGQFYGHCRLSKCSFLIGQWFLIAKLNTDLLFFCPLSRFIRKLISARAYKINAKPYNWDEKKSCMERLVVFLLIKIASNEISIDLSAAMRVNENMVDCGCVCVCERRASKRLRSWKNV